MSAVTGNNYNPTNFSPAVYKQQPSTQTSPFLQQQFTATIPLEAHFQGQTATSMPDQFVDFSSVDISSASFVPCVSEEQLNAVSASVHALSNHLLSKPKLTRLPTATAAPTAQPPTVVFANATATSAAHAKAAQTPLASTQFKAFPPANSTGFASLTKEPQKTQRVAGVAGAASLVASKPPLTGLSTSLLRRSPVAASANSVSKQTEITAAASVLTKTTTALTSEVNNKSASLYSGPELQKMFPHTYSVIATYTTGILKDGKVKDLQKQLLELGSEAFSKTFTKDYFLRFLALAWFMEYKSKPNVKPPELLQTTASRAPAGTSQENEVHPQLKAVALWLPTMPTERLFYLWASNQKEQLTPDCQKVLQCINTSVNSIEIPLRVFESFKIQIVNFHIKARAHFKAEQEKTRLQVQGKVVQSKVVQNPVQINKGGILAEVGKMKNQFKALLKGIESLSDADRNECLEQLDALGADINTEVGIAQMKTLKISST